MNDTSTETALCQDCEVPVEVPKKIQFHPFVTYQPVALCKDCIVKREQGHLMELFAQRHVMECPYKFPGWRPKI